MIIGTYLYSYIAKDCGSLKIPLNGSLIGPNITTFPNSLTFSCDRGFALKGSRVRSCQANAIWSGNETLCQGNDIIYIFRVHSLTALLTWRRVEIREYPECVRVVGKRQARKIKRQFKSNFSCFANFYWRFI